MPRSRLHTVKVWRFLSTDQRNRTRHSVGDFSTSVPAPDDDDDTADDHGTDDTAKRVVATGLLGGVRHGSSFDLSA